MDNIDDNLNNIEFVRIQSQFKFVFKRFLFLRNFQQREIFFLNNSNRFIKIDNYTVHGGKLFVLKHLTEDALTDDSSACTDLYLAIYPCTVMSKLQISKKRKVRPQCSPQPWNYVSDLKSRYSVEELMYK